MWLSIAWHCAVVSSIPGGSVSMSRKLPVAGSTCKFSAKAAFRDATHAGKDGIRSGRRRSGSCSGSTIARFPIAYLPHPVAPCRRPVELEPALSGDTDPVVDEFRDERADVAHAIVGRELSIGV